LATTLMTLACSTMAWGQNAAPGAGQRLPGQPGQQPQGQAPGQQSPGQPGQQYGQQPGQLGGQAGMEFNRHLATGLLLENQEEVALAQYAKEHAKSDDVKKFADMLIKDHKEAAGKLQRIVPQQMTAFFRGVGESGEESADQQGQRRATTGQQGAQASDPMTAFQQKVAEECFELTCKELSEHEGADFDRCFVGSQIGGHIAVLAKLKAGQQFASGELQPIIQESQDVVQRHLDMAKELAKDLEKDKK
jgi:predicted outer membrane protein